MGVPGACGVYRHAYGHSDRVVARAVTSVGDRASVDVVDLPTLSVPCAHHIADSMARYMDTKPGRPMGQMVVFYHEHSNVIHEIVYDRDFNVHPRNLRNGSAAAADASGELLRRVHGRDPSLSVALVAVRIPYNKCEVEAMLRRLWKDDWDSDSAGGRFVSSELLWRSPQDTTGVRCAYVVRELEGLVLFYSWSVVQLLAKTLVRGGPGARRNLVVVHDGSAPPIKRLRRKKRALTRATKQTCTAACRELLTRFPARLTKHVLYHVLRIPLALATGSSSMYSLCTDEVEGEDNAVRLVTMLTGLRTPAAERYDRKTLDCLEFGNFLDPNAAPRHELPPPLTLSWRDLRNRLLASERNSTINLYSTDSDVLGKWNVCVDHHRYLLSRGEIADPSLSLEPKGIFFYRSTPDMISTPAGPSFAALTRRHDEDDVGGETTRYDLLQSPLFFSSELTLLIMLTRGSDYNDAVVPEPSRAYAFREEAALFFGTACICEGGWGPFLSESRSPPQPPPLSSAAPVPVEGAGTACAQNVAREPCPKCKKQVVMPFWSVKAWYAGISAEGTTNDKHVRRAVDCAANVMAALTLGSFNRFVFGRQNAEGAGAEFDAVSRARDVFFARNTRGGIPVDAEKLRGECRFLFGREADPLCISEDAAADEEALLPPDKCTSFFLSKFAPIEGGDAPFDFEAVEIDNIPTSPAPAVPPPRRVMHRHCASTRRGSVSSLLSRHFETHTVPKPLGLVAAAGEKCMDLLVCIYLNMCGFEDPDASEALRLPVLHDLALKNLSSGTTGPRDLGAFHAAVTQTVYVMYRHSLPPLANDENISSWLKKSEGAYAHFWDRVSGGDSWKIHLPLLGSFSNGWSSLSLWGAFLMS